ncbi:MAG: hypothetical protein ACRDQZ_13525, partial [Mycobacteriales bacterium]
MRNSITYVKREIREIEADLRKMRAIIEGLERLSARDSNCDQASMLGDAALVLMERAVVEHRKELEEW